MTSLTFVVATRARVEVDPNSFSGIDPTVSVASLEDSDRPLTVGEVVWAVQPDEDGMEGIAPGAVVDINEEHRLLYIRVAWDQFREMPIDRPRINFATESFAGGSRIRLADDFEDSESRASGVAEVRELQAV